MAEFSVETAAGQAVKDWWRADGFVPLALQIPRDEPFPGEVAVSFDEWYCRSDAVEREIFDQTTLAMNREPEPSPDRDYRMGVRAAHLDRGNALWSAVVEIGTNRAVEPDIPGEMFVDAGVRGANFISFAQDINPAAGRRLIQLAMWDDGNPRDIDDVVEVIERDTSEDRIGFDRGNPEKAWTDFSITHLGRNALYSSGTLVFAQGDQKVTLSRLTDFSLQRRDETIEPVEGVVTVYAVPYFFVHHDVSHKDEYFAFHALNSKVPEGYVITTAKGRRLSTFESMVHARYWVEGRYKRKQEEEAHWLANLPERVGPESLRRSARFRALFDRVSTK